MKNVAATFASANSSSRRSVLRDHAALERGPARHRRGGGQGAGVEVVLHVDGHRIDDGGRGRSTDYYALQAPPRAADDGFDRLEDDEEVQRRMFKCLM